MVEVDAFASISSYLQDAIVTFALRNWDIPVLWYWSICPHPLTIAVVPEEYVFLLDILIGCFDESKLIGVDNFSNAISFFFATLSYWKWTIFWLIDFRYVSLFRLV